MPFYKRARPGLTVDMVIICKPQALPGGHYLAPELLLIQRGGDPFKGSWALPGGHVEEGETIPTAAKRELQEETGIVHESLRQMGTYGDPGRDPRGWMATVVFFGYVAEPKATAGDDAAAAQWFPLDQLPPMAFDHGDIVKDVLQKLRMEPGYEG